MKITTILSTFIFCLTLTMMHAQKTFPLYPGAVPNNKENKGLKDAFDVYNDPSGNECRFLTRIIIPEVYVYLPAKNNTGAAVVICPGGGYAGLAIDNEGIDVAKKLAANGIAGIVLKNRVPNTDHVINKTIVPLQDAQRAIQLVREHAVEWKINPHKVGIMGSSAGGHLAATAGTHFTHAMIDNPKKTSLRPDFMILNYPVISFADSITHRGSRDNLISEPNKPLDETLVKLYSNELQVNESTPPVFINHAYDDDAVPVANSIVFIAACQEHHVPVQSYFYTAGGHGFGMHNPTSKISWFDICLQWLKKDVLK